MLITDCFNITNKLKQQNNHLYCNKCSYQYTQQQTMMNNILSHISDEVIEYEIPDKYLQSIKDNNIPIYLDHGKNYCSISNRFI